VITVRQHGTIIETVFITDHGLDQQRYRHLRRIKAPWGKLVWCPHCHYEANADWNASVNVHHSFFKEWHWQPRLKKGA
jgi:hypothetical protein